MFLNILYFLANYIKISLITPPLKLKYVNTYLKHKNDTKNKRNAAIRFSVTHYLPKCQL